MGALETAVYWTEYVIKHGNTTNTASPAVDLDYYQYCLLDIFGIVISTLMFLFYLVFQMKKLIR